MYEPILEKSPYANCVHLPENLVRECLEYDPETGVLRWSSRGGRWGGARAGKRIMTSSFVLRGRTRNTFGVICLLVLRRLPGRRLPFRDGDGTNWRWSNIAPLTPEELAAGATFPALPGREPPSRRGERSAPPRRSHATEPPDLSTLLSAKR